MRALLVAAAGLALLAGCGDDDEQAAAPERTVTQTVTQATHGERAARAPAPVKPTKVIKLTGFSSPTANIGCYIARDGVRCDIQKRSWKPPRPQRSCDLDYGQGISLTPGDKPGFVCAGDTALGSKRKLAYGKAIQAGVLRCDSKTSGMTCKDTKTGRGFTLSRERFRLF